MSVQRIAFTGQEAFIQNKNVAAKPHNNAQNLTKNLPSADKEKSNASKYMIGATALAGVIALGILGYKGKLGKSVQEFLGGAEKAASKTEASGVKTAGHYEDNIYSGLADDVNPADRGMYGQDIYDPLDFRNEDDILSPFYKSKGMYGQDINDPLNPLNHNDMSSPFYQSTF